jgi:hypothetical protein
MTCTYVEDKRAPYPVTAFMAMQAADSYTPGMKSLATPLILATAVVVAALPASAQGGIGVVTRGAYVCELPGDAAGSAGIEQPERNFTIQSASRYSSPQGKGTYLRKGNTLTLTSGPRRGESFTVSSSGSLRAVEGGRPGRLRCIPTNN